MKPVQIDIPVLTEDLNGICLDQQTVGPNNLLLNGALVSGGVATAAAAQLVSIEGTGDNSSITFTVTGNDADGKTTSEAFAGPDDETVTSTTYFLTVTQVAVSGVISTVEVGWLAADGMATKSIPVDWRRSKTDMFFDLTAGSMTLSSQYTEDSPAGIYTNGFSTDAKWRDTDGMTAVQSDDEGNLNFSVRALRFIQTVGSTTGTCTVTAIQSEA